MNTDTKTMEAKILVELAKEIRTADLYEPKQKPYFTPVETSICCKNFQISLCYAKRMGILIGEGTNGRKTLSKYRKQKQSKVNS